MSITVDAHQHFWNFDPDRDKWMTAGTMDQIRRDFTPEQLRVLLDQNDVTGSIAVQADQSEEETKFLLDLASEHSWIRGVVGWIDLRSDTLEERLQHYRRYEKLVGFRHVLQSEPASYMLEPTFIEGVSKLSKYGFTYDLLIYWHQFESAIEMVQQLPEVRIVLDHIGKPDIKDGRILKWAKGISRLAEMPNVFCKISGLATEAHWQYWKNSDFDAYLELTFQLFGPARCMYGSDWPVCTLATSYGEWIDYVRLYISKYSEAEQKAIMGGNCLQFYGLKSSAE